MTMKILIIINTILPFLACVQLMRCIIRSHMLERRLNTIKEMELEKVGLLYLISDDKKFFQRLVRLTLYLLATSNALLFTWSISRITQNFAPYATSWIIITAVLYHLIMTSIAQLIFILFHQSNSAFLKNLKAII